MAVGDARYADSCRRRLPAIVPLKLPLTRVSWQLGTRVVSEDGATHHGTWAAVDAAWAVSVFEATDETVLIRLRSPVGREQFYGATKRDLDRALPALAEADDWHRLE